MPDISFSEADYRQIATQALEAFRRNVGIETNRLVRGRGPVTGAESVIALGNLKARQSEVPHMIDFHGKMGITPGNNADFAKKVLTQTVAEDIARAPNSVLFLNPQHAQYNIAALETATDIAKNAGSTILDNAPKIKSTPPLQAAKTSLPPASVWDMPHETPHLPHATGKLGKIFGVVGTAASGVLAAGVTLASGGSAAQAAEAGANAMLVSREGLAVAQGHMVEAAIRGLEEIPGAGVVIGEVARPVAQMAGANVEKSFLQDARSLGHENNARQLGLQHDIGAMNDKFSILRENGFGLTADRQERQLAFNMRQIGDQLSSGVGHEDKVAGTRNLVGRTAQGLANYLESPDGAHARELVKQSLNEEPKAFVEELRKTARDLGAESAPTPRASSPSLAAQPQLPMASASSKSLLSASL
ncbi:hypothetical protein ACWAT4_37135 [Bradyrhizobium manausense]